MVPAVGIECDRGCYRSKPLREIQATAFEMAEDCAHYQVIEIAKKHGFRQ